MFLKILFGFVILISVCAPARAQDKETLSQLLKSEQAAAALISEMTAYDAKSPWGSEVIWALTQRLAVKGLSGPQICTAIIASGEVSAALDADDRLFASVTLLTSELLKEKDPQFVLYDLEAVGVPAFDMLAELLQRRPDDVKDLARQRRLSSSVLFRALTTVYTLRYKGMAEKLAKKRAANP